MSIQYKVLHDYYVDELAIVQWTMFMYLDKWNHMDGLLSKKRHYVIKRNEKQKV